MTSRSIYRLAILLLPLLGPPSAASQFSIKQGNHDCRSQIPRDQALLHSIGVGDDKSAKYLLHHGADPDARDDCGIPAVAYAAASLSPNILKDLLDLGANVNVKDGLEQKTPIVWAIDDVDVEDIGAEGRQRLYEVMELLLRAGSNVNVRDSWHDRPPLIIAARNRLTEVAELLARQSAEINAIDDDDRTAYSYAAQFGNDRLKAVLLAAGADPTIGVADYKEKYGQNAFIQAASDSRTDIVEAVLASGLNPNTANQSGVTALMRVVEDSTLDALLAAGADVNKKDSAGFTALIWASFFGRESQVRKLIAAGADVNAVTNDGQTALSMAKENIKPILTGAGATR
ncbi:MAG TPA: ankyrin repeat domain-containing protein [Blastocatellia bacterium]|nr:ankyrin repeat domain-containing protein [Blastocatellia bacterium]